MTPRKRVLAVMRGEPVDRVPLWLEGFHFASKDEVCDPGIRKVVERVHDQVHFLRGWPSYISRFLVVPPQCVREVERRETGDTVTTAIAIDTPRGTLTSVSCRNTATNTSWIVEYPVESLEDIDRMLSLPWELPAPLASPHRDDLPPSFAERGVLMTHASSPMVCVSAMMPFEYYLELCATELPLITELTAVCCDRILRILDILLAPGVIEYVWTGGCEWLTPPMGSPMLYDALVQPFEQRMIERVHAAGAISHIHCHGNIRGSLEQIIARGADYTEPVEPPPDGDITFAEAKALAAGRITLGGNIEARLLENEDADTVEAAVRAAFDGGKHRMMLTNTAEPLAAMTPRMTANYQRLADVWEELSPM